MRHGPRFPYGYDPSRILVGDVDGDGASDLIYVEDNQVTLLGQVSKRWLKSRDGIGGSETKPEIAYEYDFQAYANSRHQAIPQPIFVHKIQRVYHATENRSDETIESRSYSDGFGRLIQERAQAPELVFGNSGNDVGLTLNPDNSNNSIQPAQGQRDPNRAIVSCLWTLGMTTWVTPPWQMPYWTA